MSNLTPEQRSAIHQRALELGIAYETAFRISVNATVDNSKLKSLPAKIFVSASFVFNSSPEGEDYWQKIVSQLSKWSSK